MNLSSFKIYNRELTAQEITNNFNASSTRFYAEKDGLSPTTASSSAYQIKQDYPSSSDGFYWIKNPNINGGAPFKIYADMTTDNGGWTLILKNSSNSVWTYAKYTIYIYGRSNKYINSTLFDHCLGRFYQAKFVWISIYD
jgi:hypothetical protein